MAPRERLVALGDRAHVLALPSRTALDVPHKRLPRHGRMGEVRPTVR